MKLGKLPPDLSRPRLKLSKHLTADAFTAPPTDRDWLSQVPSWPMYANDRYGDCVWAMIGHHTQAVSRYGQGVQVDLAEADLLKGYSDVTGFDASDPATDQGTVMQDAMDYWRKTGIANHKILAFAQVDHRNLSEVRAAINVFGSILVGFEFPDFAWSQLGADNDWSLPAPPGTSSQLDGGHAIHVGYYDGRHVKLTTWGDLQGMTYDFWNKYVDEAWVVITPEWLNAAGLTPLGVNLHALGDDFAGLTGEPNPFPVDPDPTPTPTPTPVPDPGVEADQALALEARKWLNHKWYNPKHKELAKALREWLTAKDL